MPCNILSIRIRRNDPKTLCGTFTLRYLGVDLLVHFKEPLKPSLRMHITEMYKSVTLSDHLRAVLCSKYRWFRTVAGRGYYMDAAQGTQGKRLVLNHNKAITKKLASAVHYQQVSRKTRLSFHR